MKQEVKNSGISRIQNKVSLSHVASQKAKQAIVVVVVVVVALPLYI